MKGIKIYLAIVTILLIVALGFGVYVWYVIQNFKQGADTLPEQPSAQSEFSEGAPSAVTPAVTSSTPISVEEPMVIDLSNLTDSQRSTLKTFGYTKESITITPAMLTCASEAVGEERLEKLVDGAAPTPLESMKLLPCFKK